MSGTPRTLARDIQRSQAFIAIAGLVVVLVTGSLAIFAREIHLQSTALYTLTRLLREEVERPSQAGQVQELSERGDDAGLRRLLLPHVQEVLSACPIDFFGGFYSRDLDQVVVGWGRRPLKIDGRRLGPDDPARQTWRTGKPRTSLLYSPIRRTWILKCDNPVTLDGRIIGHTFANLPLSDLLLFLAKTGGLLSAILVLCGLAIGAVNGRILRRIRRNLDGLTLVGAAPGTCPDFDYEEFRTVSRANQTAFAEACRLELQRRQMLENCPWGYAVFDSTGWPLVLNDAGTAILGLEQLDIPQLKDLIGKVLQQGERIEQETTVTLTQGTRVLHLAAFPIVLDSGGPGVMVWFLDLSEQRRAQTINHHRDRLSVLGELASVIAHDIRNPLTTVKSLAQLGQRFPGQIEPGKAWNSVERTVDEVVEYLESVLAFCRPGHGVLAPCSVQELFTKIKLMVQSRTDYLGIKIETTLPDADLTLMVNPLDVQHALLNLVLNAVEAIASSGQGSRIWLEAEAQSGMARIRVRNDGPGIPADRLDAIWEMYYTTKDSGNGIGLAVVKKVVETHGGTVTVVSRPGQETVFEIMLPLEPPEDLSA